MNPAELVTALADAYKAKADAGQAVEMSAYLRDQFPFHGIKAPDRREIDRQVAGRGPGRPEHHYLIKVITDCWGRPEREYKYFAVDYLRKHFRRLDPSFLDLAREMVVSGAWWDVVDPMAAGVIGPYVRANGVVEVMDSWVRADNLWVARTGLLHQLAAKEETDVERLFSYALQRSAEPDFFIRKAIGWSLRQYGRTDPVAVTRFIEANEDAFSPLTVREAMKHLRA